MKAVMFDLDNTLVCVKEGYVEESLGYAVSNFGVNYDNKDLHKIWFDSNRDNFVKELVGVDNPEEFWKVFVSYDAERRKDNTLIFNDALDVVDMLKNRGYKIGVVTSSHYKAAYDEIDLFGKEKFDSVVCAAFTEGIKPKPDSEGLEVCLGELEVDRNEVCYVGDALGDIIAAQNSQMESFLLNRDGKQIEDFEYFEPKAVISNLYELLEFV